MSPSRTIHYSKIEPQVKKSKIELDLSDINLFSKNSVSPAPMRLLDSNGVEIKISKEQMLYLESLKAPVPDIDNALKDLYDQKNNLLSMY